MTDRSPMSGDQEVDAELEHRLRDAFEGAQTPGAPGAVHDAVTRLASGVGFQSRSGLGGWRSISWLAVALVLTSVLVGSMIVGSPGRAPTGPPDPSPTGDPSDLVPSPSPDSVPPVACAVSGGAVHGTGWREIGGPNAFFNWEKGPVAVRPFPFKPFIRFDPDAASTDELSIWADRLGSVERTDGVFSTRMDPSTFQRFGQAPTMPGGLYLFELPLPTAGCWRLSAAIDGRVVGTAVIEVSALARSPGPSPTPRIEPTPWPADSMEPAADDVLPLAGRDGLPGSLHCGGMAFPFDALAAPTGAEDRSGLEYEVLRSTAGSDPDPGGDLGPNPTFREVARDANAVLFLYEHLSERSNDPRYIYIDVRRDGNDWRWAGSGDCDVRAVTPPGYGPATWTLDPAFRAPDPDTRTLHILVHELTCAGRGGASGRISPAYVTWDAREFLIEVFVQTLPDPGRCVAPPPTPATLRLPVPVGDRTLFDPIASDQSGSGGG